MITIKELRWSNCFSYGANNSINFVKAPLTQLVGKNGHGKSSIALILEEVLFNKNSKGIKKADILNRYIKDKTYTIELDLERDGNEYTIKTTRGTQQTVKLLKNGQDISAHTATQTYKIIEDIVGIDHKSFAQIVYQSNAMSLEFLTSADTARKKFLIEILNLTKYTKASEVFKEISLELGKEISGTQAKVNTVRGWLDKYEKTDLTPKQLVLVETLDPKLEQQAAELNLEISNVDKTNRKIVQNNTYKQQLNAIDLTFPPVAAVDAEHIRKLQQEQTEHMKTVKDGELFIKKLKNLSGVCPTCFSQIDSTKTQELITSKDYEVEMARASAAAALIISSELENQDKQYKQAIKAQQEFERLHQLIDNTLPAKTLDKNELQNQYDNLARTIQETKQRIKQAEDRNTQVQTHNGKIDTIKQQLQEMSEELEEHSFQLHLMNERMSILGVLTKTFSTTGLVAYKIECLVKDLESITNQYLVDLSDGRFQISFKVNSSDKLLVVVTDNGRDIDISALSGGEKARVNVATLLAIRKLMQTLSSSRINLLILDETVEALDVDGKEKLVEVLLREEHLNTFLVSHGFSHPLLDKVNVIKRSNVSRIEA
jgi:DNA repair exonuclease SbcCD ATPase subunit